MNPIDALLRIVLLPAGICAAAALLGWIAAKRSNWARDVILAIGVAVGFGAALYAFDIRPSLPLLVSEAAWWWVVWLAGAGAMLGTFETLVRAPLAVKVIVRAAASFGAAWLVLKPLVPHALSTDLLLEWSAVAGAGTAALWSVIVDDTPRPSRLSLVLPLAVALVAGTVIVAVYGPSFLYAQTLGALAVCVGTTAALSLPRTGQRLLPASVAPVVALVFVGMLTAAVGYLNIAGTVNFPFVSAVLLVASAGCASVKSWKSALVLALLAAGAAAWFASTHYVPSTDDSGW
jgi:hypothetical protein